MKILIAPDSYKDSMSAVEVADNFEAGIKKVNKDIDCIKVPMADGGEGTVKAILNVTGGEIIPVKVRDPLMREIEGFYGIMNKGETAIIEMAAASGLELLKPQERNPLLTSSFGTGQLIISAINNGVKEIIIGLGGSATNDGGAGLAEALGIVFLDGLGNIIHPNGGNLGNIDKIITDKLIPGLTKIKVTVATDVNNKLCGPEGASKVYAPQKGADKEMVEWLERNLNHFGKLLEYKFNIPIMEVEGTGAAGGLLAVLLSLTKVDIRSGFSIVSQLTGLDSKCRQADLVITGEGKIDNQTYYGKTAYGVLSLAKKYHKPVIAITGHLEEQTAESGRLQFDAVIPIMEKPCSLEYALQNGPRLLRNTAERILKLMLIDK